jgi:hypothetical protein
MGLDLSMTAIRFSRLNRRAFLSSAAICALASGSVANFGARAQETTDDQAEWRQSYETSARVSVERESRPTPS